MTCQSAAQKPLLPLGRTRRFGRTGVLRRARVIRRTGVRRRTGALRRAWVLHRAGVRRARIHDRGRALGGTRRTGIGRQCRSGQSQTQGAGAEHRSQWASGGGVRFAFQLIRHFGSSSFPRVCHAVWAGHLDAAPGKQRHRRTSLLTGQRWPNSDATTDVLLQHWLEPALTHALLPPSLGYPFAAHEWDANLQPSGRRASQSPCNNGKEHASNQYTEAVSTLYLQATEGEADGR